MSNKILQIDTRLTFGKYVGCTLESIIESDISYITWCIDNLDNFELSNEAYDIYTFLLDDT